MSGASTSIDILHSNQQLNPIFNPTALRKAKIACNFGLSGCNRVKRLSKQKFKNKLISLLGSSAGPGCSKHR